MEISELENRLKKLTEEINKETFIYDLLLAYDFPKATISRIKSGDLNMSKNLDEILIKKKIYFKSVLNQDLHSIIDELARGHAIEKHNPRFIVVTDFITFLAIDTKTKDSLDITVKDIHKYYDFFNPWIGKEKVKLQNNNIADVKAATKLGLLYDTIIQDNPEITKTEHNRHSLNIFFARLLFCLFAEDTGIFKDGIFTSHLASHTTDDGSDLKEYLELVFSILNSKSQSDGPKFLSDFPYVNGGLFKEKFGIPFFSRKSRNLLIQAGELDWALINPDIFGSMIQAIADPKERSNFGVHYTSVQNILKVINPLFMDSFREKFEKNKSEKDIEKLLTMLYELKIFDPACGSGNFLIVAYKEICNFEIKLFEELQKINPSKWSIARSGIRLNQFYGITIKDFDAEIAKLSLYISEHQMNGKFKDVFGETKPTLPLEQPGNILCANSLAVSWEDFCDNNQNVYLIGNPPYVGSSLQTKDQKNDMASVLGHFKNYKNLDYIACWFYKGASYIRNKNCTLSFVSTNSINQGEQVDLLWPKVLDLGIAIEFAYLSFKWTNNAQNKAGVSCVIIGLSNINNSSKFIFDSMGNKQKVKQINPYLIDDDFVAIKRVARPLANIPEMKKGNMPTDDNNFILSSDEKLKLISLYPDAEKFIKKYLGAEELVSGSLRWCLWIDDKDRIEAEKIPPIRERIKKVETFRLSSDAPSTVNAAKNPHRFLQIQSEPENALVIPSVSSETRVYIPIIFVDNQTVCSNATQVIYNPPIYLFSLLSSYINSLWVKTIGGRLETRIRYSSLCYNSFPIIDLTDYKKDILSDISLQIIDIREKYSGLKLSEIYDPKKMPNELLIMHQKNDIEVERCFTDKKFSNDLERIRFLFNSYKKLMKNSKYA